MKLSLSVEQLEDRVTPSITVNGVKVDAPGGLTGNLNITGNNYGNRVDLSGTGVLGRVAVYVDCDYVGTFSGIKNIKVNLKDGEDSVYVNALQISKDLNVDTGRDQDYVSIDNSGKGATKGDVLIRNVKIEMDNDYCDYVNWQTDCGYGSQIGKNVSINGAARITVDGDGSGDSIQQEDVTIGGNLDIDSNVACTEPYSITADNVNVGGNTNVHLGNDSDRVNITNCSFAGNVDADLGGGCDYVRLYNNSVYGKLEANGGSDYDTVDDAGSNYYADPDPQFKNFENI